MFLQPMWSSLHGNQLSCTAECKCAQARADLISIRGRKIISDNHQRSSNMSRAETCPPGLTKLPKAQKQLLRSAADTFLFNNSESCILNNTLQHPSITLKKKKKPGGTQKTLFYPIMSKQKQSRKQLRLHCSHCVFVCVCVSVRLFAYIHMQISMWQ